MGIWRGIKAVVTLGGSLRLENEQRRYDEAVNLYRAIEQRLALNRNEIERLLRELRAKVGLTKKRFRTANRMIAPRCLASLKMKSDLPAVVVTSPVHGAFSTRSRDSIAPNGSNIIVATSALAGTSAALVAWQSAQVIGIASTGTAMIGLHGAAASNAGWALFGGGSLASGGGGMALGHLLLPGAGAILAVGIGAVMTHKQANQVAKLADQVERVNEQNGSILATADANLSMVHAASLRFETADARWNAQFRDAKHALQRFGWLTVLYRFIRFKVSGLYYTTAEWEVVTQLERATRDFFATMSVTRND